MTELRFTLVTDGPSDAALIYPLTWLIQVNRVKHPLVPQWADLRRLREQPHGLRERVNAAIGWYPCELLFIHRDAERAPRPSRVAEIQEAVRLLSAPPVVCVVPVRMTEAWFLFDEAAIRHAAGNPNSRDLIELPKLSRVEDEPNPKQVLRSALLAASGMSLRRQRGFPVTERIHRLAELIDDFSPLRALSAFRALEEDLQNQLEAQGWNR